jgi:hypothetical protein
MSNDWTESELAAAWAQPRRKPTPPCQVGDRVRLTSLMRNPGSTVLPVESLPVGTEGTVKFINTHCGDLVGYQVTVEWDNGRRLDLLPGDRFEVITQKGQQL